MCVAFAVNNDFPEVGESIVEITFKNVDLPLPDGPIIATNSPLSTCKFIFLKRYEGLFPHTLLRRFYV